MDIKDYFFFDLTKQKYKPELFLATPQRQIITKLHDAVKVKCMIKLGRVNELDFFLPYDIVTQNSPYQPGTTNGGILDGVSLTRNDVLDQIRDRFLIKFKLGEYTEWYMIREQEDIGDENKGNRHIRCFSLACELKNIKIIRYDVISYTLLEILKGKPFDNLKGILTDNLWSVGHIDDSILEKYRAYDCTVKNGLDIVLELAEIFDCVPVFDTEHRLINFYDMDNIGENRGLKIDRKKYLKNISKQSISDDVTTRLKVYGRDGLTIRRINPLGTDYIEDYSYFMFPYGLIDDEGNVADYSYYMSTELCDAIDAHRTLINENSPTFTSLIGKLEVINQLLIAKTVELRALQDELRQQQDNIKVAERGHAGGTTVQFFQGRIDDLNIRIEKQKEVVEQLNTERETITQEIADIRELLSESQNYTAELLEEKRLFTLEDDFISNNIVEEDALYKEGLQYFNEVNKPKTSVSVDIVDFLDVLEEQHNWDKLKLGDIIRAKYGKFNLNESVRIVELDYDFGARSINIVITNVKDFVFTDDIDSLAKLLHRNINMTRAVDVSRIRWDGIDHIRKTLEDILANPWETLGLEEDVDWSIEDALARLYDELEQIIIDDIEIPEFDSWFDDLLSRLDGLFDDFLEGLEWPEIEPTEPIVVEEFYEYIVVDYSPDGFQFNFVQQYTEEPAVQISFQKDEGYEGEFDTASFKPIAEHVRGDPVEIEGEDPVDAYIGLKVYFEGSSIPAEFSGKVSVAAVCTGLVEEELGS